MLISLKPNIKISQISNIGEEKYDYVKLQFNIGDYLIYPKSIFDFIYLLSGHFTTEQIISKSLTLRDLKANQLIDDFFSKKLIFECGITDNEHSINAKKLSKYTVHFPKLTNINIMIAILLQKNNVNSVFYEKKTISSSDVVENIYFYNNDIDKDIGTALKYDIGIKTITLSESDFTIDILNPVNDIIVNSNTDDWIEANDFIIINTWNYQKYFFSNFDNLFEAEYIDYSFKTALDGFILSTRAIDDMIFSVKYNVT